MWLSRSSATPKRLQPGLRKSATFRSCPPSAPLLRRSEAERGEGLVVLLFAGRAPSEGWEGAGRPFFLLAEPHDKAVVARCVQ